MGRTRWGWTIGRNVVLLVCANKTFVRVAGVTVVPFCPQNVTKLVTTSHCLGAMRVTVVTVVTVTVLLHCDVTPSQRPRRILLKEGARKKCTNHDPLLE